MKEKIVILEELIKNNIENENIFIELFKENDETIEENIQVENKIIKEDFVDFPFENDNYNLNMVSLIDNPDFINIENYNNKPNNINLVLYKLLLFLGKDINLDIEYSITNNQLMDVLILLNNHIVVYENKIKDIKEKEVVMEKLLEKYSNHKVPYLIVQIDILKKNISSERLLYIKLHDKLKLFVDNFKKN